MNRGILLAPTSWGGGDDVAALESAAEQARSIGWSVHIPEHRERASYVPSALVLAAMLGARLPGLDVATAGVIVGRRQPQTLRDEAVVVQRFVRTLGGRFRLGVVAGYDPNDFPEGAYASRFSVLDEFLGLIRHGDDLPVLVGGHGDRALGRAAAAGAWLAPTVLGFDELAHRIATLRDLSPSARVTVVRRFEGLASSASARVRTPRRAVWTSQTAGEGAAALERLGVDEIVVGPAHSAAGVDEIRGALTRV